MENELNIKSEKQTGMRTVAAILYSVFVLFQFLALHAFIGKAALTGISMLAILQIAEAIGAAFFAVWLFSSKDFLTKQVANKTIAATALVVISDMVFITDSADLIELSIKTDFAFLQEMTFVKFIAIAIRLVLLILAAFFVVFSLEGPEQVILQAEEGEPEILSADVVEVVDDGKNTSDGEEKETVKVDVNETASTSEEVDIVEEVKDTEDKK